MRKLNYREFFLLSVMAPVFINLSVGWNYGALFGFLAQLTLSFTMLSIQEKIVKGAV